MEASFKSAQNIVTVNFLLGENRFLAAGKLVFNRPLQQDLNQLTGLLFRQMCYFRLVSFFQEVLNVFFILVFGFILLAVCMGSIQKTASMQ